MLTEQQAEFEKPEITLLREWLPRISGEKRAYIKGASEALLYMQENQGLLISPNDISEEKHF